jgi:hypothetical protein
MVPMDAVGYDMLNQQFISALKSLAFAAPSDEQEMAAAVLRLIQHKPEAIHVIDNDYKEAAIMEHWTNSTCKKECTSV